MIDAGLAVALRDREVHARIIEHPFRIVGLDDGRLGAEQLRIEAQAGVEVLYGNVDVETFNSILLAVGWRLRTRRSGGLAAVAPCLGEGVDEAIHRLYDRLVVDEAYMLVLPQQNENTARRA